MFSSDVIVAEKSIFDIVVGRWVPWGGETTIVQTRIGPSLIKRDSRFAWLALIDSAKILTITGARSWLLPTKSYRVKRLLLHFTFYRTDAVLYRSTYLFLYWLYRVSSRPKGCSTSLPKCLYKMSVHVTHTCLSRSLAIILPDGRSNSKCLFVAAKAMRGAICLNN